MGVDLFRILLARQRRRALPGVRLAPLTVPQSRSRWGGRNVEKVRWVGRPPEGRRCPHTPGVQGTAELATLARASRARNATVRLRPGCRIAEESVNFG